ncbi:MAG: FKBP-type peptidyl-prolyl cis-trans isomerase [Solobacterium sp.]|nr:FKBP-type peptidyl-prolyl cis-trans isomerase [Solobacterium sp.]
MKIAVTYDNGNVFQHFGRTENFKIYEVKDGEILSSEVVGSGGRGHESLAEVLLENNVDLLICGGLGAGAQNALASAGVAVAAGAQGDADEAVKAFLRGELQNTGANCDHHHEEGGCGHHEEGGCGSCGGCHAPAIEGKNVGKTVRVHYCGTFNDGTQFDSSYDRGTPLEFVCGAGMMIRGFDQAVADMDPGQIVDVHLMPEEAYGQPNPMNIFQVEIVQMPGSEGLDVGQQVMLRDDYGQRFRVRVIDKDETTITFDANHEMAGKELNFRIELVEIL